MKISSKGKNAVEALLYMAVYSNNEPIKIKQICEELKISEKYLEQIFFKLKKAGILGTVRGQKGGYFINMDLDKITVHDILNSVENDIVPVICINNADKCPSNMVDTCTTRKLWVDIYDEIKNVIDNLTLDDLKSTFDIGGINNENINKRTIWTPCLD